MHCSSLVLVPFVFDSHANRMLMSGRGQGAVRAAHSGPCDMTPAVPRFPSISDGPSMAFCAS